MLQAIELAGQFSKDTPDFEAYQVDLKTKSAVERQLVILGEAVNKYSKAAPESPLNNIPQIVSFRNRLAHNYDEVDDTIVWAVLKKHLPALRLEVLNLLKD
jgi:uncharacterized protein with HEPN domain